MPFELSVRSGLARERSWNGVAILARNHAPVLTRASLPGNPQDHQARYIEAAVQGVLISSIYLPTGIPSLDRNSTTSWPGLSASMSMPPNSWRAVLRGVAAITTSYPHRRHLSDSIVG